MAQKSVDISLSKKVKGMENMISLAFPEDLSYVAIAQDEFYIFKGDSIVYKEITGIVKPQAMEIQGDSIFFGHKIFLLNEGKFINEGNLFSKISLSFKARRADIENAFWIVTIKVLLIDGVYAGSLRLIGAEDDNYTGEKYRLLLYQENGDMKEISSSNYSNSAISGNEKYLVASSIENNETNVWDYDGNKIAELPGGYTKFIFHKKQSLAMAVYRDSIVDIWQTDTWEKVQNPEPLKASDFVFHTEEPLAFLLESDTLTTYYIEGNTTQQLLNFKLEEECTIIGVIGANRLFTASKSGNIYIYDISIQ